jgi:hypothetical protein
MAKEKKFEKQIGSWAYYGLEISKDQILEAMSKTTSNNKAAEYLNISYATYKKYAKAYRDDHTGRTLFDVHMNQPGKGVQGRAWINGQFRVHWDKILTTGQKATSERIQKLRSQLKEYGKLEEKCYRCGFCTKRLEDSKVPLVLNFKNGDKTDWTIQNLEYVCYNCMFLYALDFYDYKEDIINKVELYALNAPQGKKERKEILQLDDFYIDHIKQLGLEYDQLNQEQDISEEQIKSSDLDSLVDFV